MPQPREESMLRPNLPARAQPPHGSHGSSAVAGVQDDLLYEGRCKHSAYLGGYLKAALFAVLLAGATYALTFVPALAAWPVAWLMLAALPPFVAVFLRHRTTRYKITGRRIEYERGILTKRVDSLELWRVVDVSYSQTLLDRLLGHATIRLTGIDRSDPAFELHGLPRARKLFEDLREAVHHARQQGRPLEFAGGADELPVLGP